MRVIKRNYLLILFSLFSFITATSAQEIGIGEWRDHLPYQHVIAVTDAGNRIYAATPYSLFYLDFDDNSLTRVTKINGLSDVGISGIEYSKKYNTLVVAYSNANIDLIKGDKIVNLSDIKRKPILGDKSINSIVFIDDKAYLSCGFGIVVLDIDKEEFPEPIYYIGPEGSSINVHDITYDDVDSTIYAATESGVYSAKFYHTNLANFAEWSKETSGFLPVGPFNHIVAFHNRIYVNQFGEAYATDHMYVKAGGTWKAFIPENTSNRYSVEVHHDRLIICMNLTVHVYKPDGTFDYSIYSYNPGTVSPRDAILMDNNVMWIGDEFEGLAKVTNIYTSEHYKLNGPEFPDAFALASGNNDVWAVPGGRNSSFKPLYRNASFAGFVDWQWQTIDKVSDPILTDLRDVLAVAVNPSNTKNVFLGTYGYGLLEYTNGVFVNRYTDVNSSLEQHVLSPGRVDIGGLAFDADNNLWVVNSSASSLLSRRTPAGEWKSYSLGNAASGIDAGKIVIDQQNQKWILGRNLLLYVFNDNNTPDISSDDQAKRLTSSIGNGALPGHFVKSIAVDREGQVWLGTDEGVAVFYSPQNVFSTDNFDAQKVLIEQDGYGQYLLSAETVTAIAVDGSNRKWFGTDRAGLFLMSADGTKQILHFTIDNSPLLSNTITDLTITASGEVFIATPAGMVSYRAESVTPEPTLDKVVVFPNPVRPEYSGNIAIKGLVEGSSVKITDISGNLVFSTEALGGQAIWNGCNFDGIKAKSGVYLVFISNQDGSQTNVAKIMIIN
ncbi:MAG: two-component regulator propeller domain-containing protein [Lentimicrobiaceae bacterium]